jgi:Cu+-exporting ATPase
MQVKDPVCGMMIDDQTAAARSTYQGKTYYFCSEVCKKTFDANPTKYTAEVGAGSTSR